LGAHGAFRKVVGAVRGGPGTVGEFGKKEKKKKKKRKKKKKKAGVVVVVCYRTWRFGNEPLDPA
jgi:hypothetical protein